ncbi:aminoacyl-tRNA hydrolase [Paenibacillus sp. GCM10023248]|uniref:aminoacyl-tRNA hydrolase n=1 Tax=Bacillales TaxID=1385 RepID=UPI002379BD6A|nr:MULTISPECIES: aminoacyl-tRNA hydrolase [Bacillales]MDD9272036.1 aminoacyl-tRNA hydrolase [Paenibacillus sp. MAHUQ-63]MDR6885146.1 PTH1 family peptidyl-tRNA hydrolase [Bacillus sp. 3255]
MKCFIGLGNPGKQYELNRHNVGFLAIDRFAAKMGISSFQNKGKGLLAEGNVNGTKVFLLKPMTYMNLSGESMRAVLDFYKIKLEDVVIIYDDMDTPYGQIRLRYQGSAGGHNGIKSIIQHAGTQSFNRIRVGVNRPAPGYNIADYVLSNFTKDEMKSLEDVLDLTCEAMLSSMNEPFEKTMGKFNK